MERGTNDPPAAPAPAPLTFDIVIVTRNRPQALELSLPLILGQSRLPQKIIVIDSSDDHAAVAQVVGRVTAGCGAEIILRQSPKGMTRQRNIGLGFVTAPVVMFPDDDSLLHPGTTAAMMAVYERDTEGRIAGVCAADAPEPPPGVLDGAGYRRSTAHARSARLMRLRHRIETRITALNPFLDLGRMRMAQIADLGWLAALNCVPVEYMTGYRMSYRTAAIRATGFEEIFEGYALYEDIDASFGVSKSGGLVGADSARIYHHRYPGGRPDRFALAAMAVLNRAYVLTKHFHRLNIPAADAARIRARFHAYCRLRLLLLAPAAVQAEGRAALRGTLAAWRESGAVLRAQGPGLAAAYLRAKAALGLNAAA